MILPLLTIPGVLHLADDDSCGACIVDDDEIQGTEHRQELIVRCERPVAHLLLLMESDLHER